MARTRKPRVLTRCVANTYSRPTERIIEFSFASGPGGLIAFRETDGAPAIEVYRVDGLVKVGIQGDPRWQLVKGEQDATEAPTTAPDPLHPESQRQLRALLKLHGSAKLYAALDYLTGQE